MEDNDLQRPIISIDTVYNPNFNMTGDLYIVYECE